VPRGGWGASLANQLMENFKKESSKKGTNEWYWKEDAVKTLATELTTILPKNSVVFSIPSSKLETDPEYDPRFDMLFKQLDNLGWQVEVAKPISCKTSQIPAHLGGASRNPAEIKDNYHWNGFDSDCPEEMYIIDDVITTGGHFSACKDLILEHCPETSVIGIFFCKTIFDTDENNFDIEPL
jgi:hypothetical protein